MKKHLIEILYADEAMVVVSKPSGVPVIPERSGANVSLYEYLQQEFEDLMVVHRIDKGTSGLVCFARGPESHRHLSMQFQEHKVGKEYLAFVSGRVVPDAATIDLPIAESVQTPGKMVVNKNGKAAISHYQVLKQYKHVALLSVSIETGRTHQIRVHLKYHGNPLLVDELYTGKSGFFLSEVKKKYKMSDEEERPIISRLTLHAYKLRLTHPVSAEVVEFTDPLPKDLATLQKLLEKYD